MKPGAALFGLLALWAVTLLGPGCATKPAVVADSARLAQKSSFELVDQRTQDERTTKWLSNTISSCVYTVRQFGDESISPDRISLLRADLDSRLHGELTGKTLLVTHYGIYLNSSQRSRTSNSLRGGGFLQSLLDLGIESHIEHRCKPEEMAAGWLGPDDGKKAHSPVIIDISVSLDGKMRSVHSIYSPDREISIKTDEPETAAAIGSAIKRAADQLIAELLVN